MTTYTEDKCTPNELGDIVDTSPGYYYVSIRDGKRFGLLRGPFATHQQALDQVDEVMALPIVANSPEAVFATFGTCRLHPDYPGKVLQGKLNDRFMPDHLAIPY